MKTIKEMVEVMTAYDNGAEIDYRELGTEDPWSTDHNPCWDWAKLDYRVTKENEAITIEKWLCEYPPLPTQHGGYFVIEKQAPFALDSGNKVKLLDTYKVEI